MPRGVVLTALATVARDRIRSETMKTRYIPWIKTIPREEERERHRDRAQMKFRTKTLGTSKTSVHTHIYTRERGAL